MPCESAIDIAMSPHHRNRFAVQAPAAELSLLRLVGGWSTLAAGGNRLGGRGFRAACRCGGDGFASFYRMGSSGRAPRPGRREVTGAADPRRSGRSSRVIGAHLLHVIESEMRAIKPITSCATNTRRSPLASRSVAEHLLRGVLGLILAGVAIVLCSVVGPVALLLLPLTAVAWRGCPTCWTVGLLGTLADTQARREHPHA